MNSIENLNRENINIRKRLKIVESHLNLTGTVITCLRCKEPARQGSNYCQACFDYRVLGTEEDTLEDQIRRCNEDFIDGYAKQLDREMMNELKKKGECTTIRDFCSNLNMVCPIDVRGCKSCEYWYKYKPTPDLPLKCKVAVIMGWEHCSCNGIDDWMGYAPNLLRSWSKIPDYPTDLEAMIEAANTYFDKLNLKWGLCHLPDSIDKGYYQAYYFKDANKDRDKFVCGETAAEALSRLVVLHAESR